MFLQLVSLDHFLRLRQSLLQLSYRDALQHQHPHPTSSRHLDGSMLLAPTACLWGGHSYPSAPLLNFHPALCHPPLPSGCVDAGGVVGSGHLPVLQATESCP